ncbi:hypothetical protein H1R20_g12847, partial [Candolleomyces eurysporus]
MLHSKTNATYNAVPTLDGSNYVQWSQTMELYLLSKRMWQLVDGKLPKPASPADPTSDAGKAVLEKIDAWTEKSGVAKGLILLKIREDLRAVHMKSDTPKIWQDLITKFGATSNLQVFSWFCGWYKFAIPGNQSLQKEFAHWDLLVSKMKAASVEIPEKILAMQLVAIMPPAYSNIVPLMVADINKKELTVEKVKSYMLTEWERKQKPANRISAVQQKGNAPLFHQQQKAPQPAASSSKQRTDHLQQQQKEDKKKRQHAGRSKKGKGKGKANAHAADTGSDSELDIPNADNLFASLSLADCIQPAPISVADEPSPEKAPTPPLQHKPYGRMTATKKNPYRNNPFNSHLPINNTEYDPAHSQAHYDAVHTPIPTINSLLSQHLPMKSLELGLLPKFKKSRKVAETLQVVKSTETMKMLKRANFDSEEQMAPTDEVAMVETAMAKIEARDEALFTDDEDSVSLGLEHCGHKRSRSLLPDPEEPNSKHDNLDPSYLADFGHNTEKIKLDTMSHKDFREMYGTHGEPPFLISALEGSMDTSNVIPGLVWRKEHVETGDIVETTWRKSMWITGDLNSFWDDHKHGLHKGKAIWFCPDGYCEVINNVNNHEPGSFSKLKEYVTVYHHTGLYLDFGDKPLTEP